jgi:hypothetical protein
MECKPYTDLGTCRMPRRLGAAAALALAIVASGPSAPAQSATPLVGGLTALPAVTVGPNRLTNGGFEAAIAAPWSGGPGWTLDRRTSHTGAFSYRREAGAPTAATTVALSPGTYRFSAWVKTKDLAGNLRLRFDLRPDAHSWFTADIGRGTAEWSRYELTDLVVTQPATVTLKLEAEDGATGTAWFDDVTLEEQLPAPLQTFLLYPNFRGMVFDDGPSTLTFDLQVAPPGREFGRYTVRGVLRDEATGRVVSAASYPARDAFVAELDGGGMRLGTAYVATFSLIAAGSGTEVYASPAYRVSRAPAAARAAMNVSFDRRNRIEVGGVPRFLLGGDDPRLARRTAAAGLKVAVVDACATTAAGAFAQYERARRGDPGAVILATAAPTTDLRRWRDVADIVALDAHPMFGPEPAVGYDHRAVAQATALSRAAVRDARPVVSMLPFSQLSSLGRRPTLIELRGHAYMAIVEGARGLWWSSVGDRGCAGDCREQTQDMDNLTRVIDELAALEPVLLADDAPDALSGNSNPNIKAKVKLVNGKGFVLAYNASGSRQSATFTWSAAPATVTVHAEDRVLVASGRSFTDTFGPFAAHVYVVGAGADGAN